MKRTPKYRVGQVVNVHSFIEKRLPGETGPGFKLKQGWKWGWCFGKITKVIMPSAACKPTASICYFLHEFPSAMPEEWLRPLTDREASR